MTVDEVFKTVVLVASPAATFVGFRLNGWMESLKDPDSIKEIRDKLSYKSRYKNLLREALDEVDQFLGKQPFSANSYSACLRFAVAYVLTSIMIIWFVSGENTSGISNALPAGESLLKRFIAVLCCASATYFLFQVTLRTGWKAIAFST